MPSEIPAPDAEYSMTCQAPPPTGIAVAVALKLPPVHTGFAAHPEVKNGAPVKVKVSTCADARSACAKAKAKRRSDNREPLEAKKRCLRPRITGLDETMLFLPM